MNEILNKIPFSGHDLCSVRANTHIKWGRKAETFNQQSEQIVRGVI